jgi:tRNA (mo5U34)-methyltransferase
MNYEAMYLDIIQKIIPKLPSSLHTPELKQRLFNKAPRFNNPLAAQQMEASLAMPEDVAKNVKNLTPWRKGPFQLGDYFLDAEWQCHMKWKRIEALLPDIAGASVLDLGSGNGYYMFEAHKHNPKVVIGLDPSALFFSQFQAIQAFYKKDKVQVLPMGWDDLDLFEAWADVLFCFGILYHHPEPKHLLKTLKACLKPGGCLLLETLVLNKKGSHCLVPEKRYAKMKNVFHVPSTECLIEWFEDAGFRVDAYSEAVATSIEEQRITDLTFRQSLVDFLDPEDRSKTVEGYPAPTRQIFRVYA